MALFNSFLATLRRDEEGQGLAEYALILALIAIIAIIALIFLGNQVSTHPEHGRQLGLRPRFRQRWTAGHETGGLSLSGVTA